MTRRKKPGAARTGSTFDSLLEEDGVLHEVEAVAIKRVIAWQVARFMKAQRISKAAMAARMDTSRSQLDRLLDPTSSSVNLATIARAAHALGLELKIELIAPPRRRAA